MAAFVPELDCRAEQIVKRAMTRPLFDDVRAGCAALQCLVMHAGVQVVSNGNSDHGDGMTGAGDLCCGR